MLLLLLQKFMQGESEDLVPRIVDVRCIRWTLAAFLLLLPLLCPAAACLPATEAGPACSHSNLHEVFMPGCHSSARTSGILPLIDGLL